MKIVDIKVDDLVPYENNPRYNDNAVDAVAKSIQEFGFKVPCVIDGNNNVITGHTRIKACKQLGIEEVPCVVADDLTEEQIKSFRLVDNRTGELSDWDFYKLEQELSEIVMDMTPFTFEEEESTTSSNTGSNSEISFDDLGNESNLVLTYTHEDYMEVIELISGLSEGRSNENVIMELLKNA